MHWRKISGLVLLGVGLAAPAVAASRAALADAAEQRDKTSVRKLLDAGVDVNAAPSRWDHCAALGRVLRGC